MNSEAEAWQDGYCAPSKYISTLSNLSNDKAKFNCMLFQGYIL